MNRFVTEAVLYVSADLEPERRKRYLDEACQGDVTSCRRIESLLLWVGDEDAFADAVRRGVADTLQTAMPEVGGRRGSGTWAQAAAPMTPIFRTISTVSRSNCRLRRFTQWAKWSS
jgi:hypothetical protein